MLITSFQQLEAFRGAYIKCRHQFDPQWTYGRIRDQQPRKFTDGAYGYCVDLEIRHGISTYGIITDRDFQAGIIVKHRTPAEVADKTFSFQEMALSW